MKWILLILLFGACLFYFACAKEEITPTSTDMTPASTMATTASSQAKVSKAGEEHHVKADLVPVGGSGITGHVNIEQLPHGGVNISVVANGLTPGVEYLSLYYENHTCAVEPYEEDDVIGTYTGNNGGVGHAQNKLEDDLDEVNSVSVRRSGDFTLLSCANIHP